MFVVLDSSPLGVLSSPHAKPSECPCTAWTRRLLSNGHTIFVPEIIDYEIRRELLRSNKLKGIRRLDRLILQLEYLPITTEVVRLAAELWARSRQQGYPTADDLALDIDVILAAQALALNSSEVVVATSNVSHLSKFVNAAEWSDIQP